MRVYLANVGTNAADGFAGPLFDNGKFEFIPIREKYRSFDVVTGVVRYRDLRSHYDAHSDLLRYIPAARHNQACHSDPEFENFTYGDNVDGGRAANLRHAEPGDALLFLARLERWRGGQRTREYGFHLLGGLHIENVYPNIAEPPEGETAARIARNAHLLRAQASGDWRTWGCFHVFTGSERSRRFERAVPMMRELCDAVLRDKDGAPWRWPPHRSDLSVIGSYTRTCRAVLDTSIPEQARRLATLRSWIIEHTGERDAELLG